MFITCFVLRKFLLALKRQDILLFEQLMLAGAFQHSVLFLNCEIIDDDDDE